MNKSIVGLLFVLVLCFCYIFVNAQLVNVESKRMQNDTTRFAGAIRASYSYKQTNDTKLSFVNASLTTQVRSKSLKDVYLFLGSYDLTRSNSDNLSNTGFLHARYTRKLNDSWRIETFAQIQTNEKLLIDKRTLLGIGPRLKLFSKDNLKSSFGALYMYEIEQTLEEIHQNNLDHRLSSYFTFTYAFPNDNFEINTITYYQPVVTNFSDFRITNQTNLSFQFIKSLSFEVGINYLFDASPPVGVISNSFATKMGVKLVF
ncbi:MAG: hypothetical protein C0596_17215 [Marinilabiliales bacterium]|nr:MAG: hypothetical protein C0596_17215 [Marinilabiliales bacterium]